MSVGLYIHVPFCRNRCHFCAFYLEIYRATRALAYVKSLSQEIELHAAQATLDGRLLDSVYFGGGTPTTLPVEELCRILQLIREQLGLHDKAEMTVEAHPDTVNEKMLMSLRDAGFNRISFGMQSTHEEELMRIGRHALPEKVRAAVAHARAAGFDSINLDLIYGLPGQSRESWRATLLDAVALKPTHLSCYALTIEEGTRLQRDFQRAGSPEADSVLHLIMEQETDQQLIISGFQRYEISNFCKPGYECRHNLLYWTDQDYIGLGPSAQSYIGSCRFGNVDDLEMYGKALNAGRLPIAQSERLSPTQRRREGIVFGLRMIRGIDRAVVDTESTDQRWNHAFTQMINQGLIDGFMGRIKLTEMGRRFADTVAVALL